jgi:hypothetical protein
VNRRALLGTHEESYIRTECIKHLFENGSDVLRPAYFQVCGFDIIGQRNSLKRAAFWKWNLERIAFGLVCYPTD